jgi:hypothetical protein
MKLHEDLVFSKDVLVRDWEDKKFYPIAYDYIDYNSEANGTIGISFSDNGKYLTITRLSGPDLSFDVIYRAFFNHPLLKELMRGSLTTKTYSYSSKEPGEEKYFYNISHEKDNFLKGLINKSVFKGSFYYLIEDINFHRIDHWLMLLRLQVKKGTIDQKRYISFLDIKYIDEDEIYFQPEKDIMEEALEEQDEIR